MATQMVPFSIEKLDEGEFLDDVNTAVLDMQKQLEVFRKTYGDAAHKGKATLTIKLDLEIADATDGAYSIGADFTTKMPKRPKSHSIGLSGETQDGQPAVLVRQSGSDRDDPRQGKFATRDGNMTGQGGGDGSDND